MLFDNIVDFLNALRLLYEACPRGKKTNWNCQRCGLWLGAVDLDTGLTVAGHFA